MKLSRRDFLKGSILTIGVAITPLGTKLLSAEEVKKAIFVPNAFVELTSDGFVTVLLPNSEMGQGIMTSTAMIVADEIEADWNLIRVRQAPAGEAYANPIFHLQMTVGSAATRGFYFPLRKAGAAARVMLITAAAKTWKVPEAECQAFNGAVKHKKTGRSLTYGKLCGTASKLPIPKDPPLKKESEFRYMGKPMARLDIPDKVAGTAVFGMDVQVPDMLYGVIERPPAYGAEPASFDENAAMAVKGVAKVARTPHGIAVIADSTFAALKGRDALKVNWSKGSHPDMNDQSIEKSYFEGLDKPGIVAASRGNVEKALNESAKVVEATYFPYFCAHANMETMNATAYVQKDRCDVWAPTQSPAEALFAAMGLTKLPPPMININTTYLGTGFGRRGYPDFVIDALACSQSVGKPVKVLWTREEDLKNDQFRIASAQRIRVSLDSRGSVTGWSHKVSCPSIMKWMGMQQFMRKDGLDVFGLVGIYDYEGSPTGSDGRTAYEIPNWRLEQYLSDLPIMVSPWRSIANVPNVFVMESFMDELARAAGKDPVAFRLELLKNNRRARRALETVAEKGGWGRSVPQGQGRGIARHQWANTHVGAVADISVNEKDGNIRVHKLIVAIDCGPNVNPDTIVAQVEGGSCVGCSSALKERLHFANGGVKTANFDDYKLLRMTEAPEVEAHIIRSPEKENLGGVGEPSVTVIAPAIANAFFNLTGVRVRRLPLDRETVLEALKTKGV